jgi:hypothetical protein
MIIRKFNENIESEFDKEVLYIAESLRDFADVACNKFYFSDSQNPDTNVNNILIVCPFEDKKKFEEHKIYKNHYEKINCYYIGYYLHTSADLFKTKFNTNLKIDDLMGNTVDFLSILELLKNKLSDMSDIKINILRNDDNDLEIDIIDLKSKIER